MPSRRQGLSFGVKQAAIPVSTLLAGAAVPAVALTARLAVGVRAGRPCWPAPRSRLVPAEQDDGETHARPERRPGHRRAGRDRCRPPRWPPAPPTRSARSWSTPPWRAASRPGPAGLALTLGGAVCVVARIAGGWQADLRPHRQVGVIAALLVCGAAGLLLLAVPGIPALVAGVVLGFGLGWSWPGPAELRGGPAASAGAGRGHLDHADRRVRRRLRRSDRVGRARGGGGLSDDVDGGRGRHGAGRRADAGRRTRCCSARPVGDEVAQRFQRAPRLARRAAAPARRAPPRRRSATVSRARFIAADSRSRSSASACSASSVIGPVPRISRSRIADASVSSSASAYSTGSVGHALAQVGARRLAGLHRLGGDVEQVVGELERDADRLAVPGQRLDVRRRRAGEHAAEPGRRRDQRAGLLGDHVQVVLDRVAVRAARRSRRSARAPAARTSAPAAAPPPARARRRCRRRGRTGSRRPGSPPSCPSARWRWARRAARPPRP